MAHRKVSRNAPCPCGSGKKYKQCCIRKNFEWLEDDDGNIFKSMPISDEMSDLLDEQRQAFIAKHGREPGPDDPVFPDMPHFEHAEHQMIQAMKKAGIDPAIIHATEATGRLVTEDNQHFLSDMEIDEWNAAIEAYRAEHGSPQPPELGARSSTRLTEAKIKAAIQHPEQEVRLTALRYFDDSYSRDESIMPLVIQAVETYGVQTSFSILREAERVPQTDQTIDWLITELRREDLDLEDVRHDNYRFAIGLVICEANPGLVAKRHREITETPLFPAELSKSFEEVCQAAAWDWDRTWQEFLVFNRKLSRKREWSQSEHRRIHRLIRLLARHPNGENQVLALLQRHGHDIDPGLAEWIDPYVVDLAGFMRLEAAIPHIIERAHLGEDDVADQCGDALGRIGTDAVAKAIASDWDCGDYDFQNIMTSALEKIHTDFCARLCLEFLHVERYSEVSLELGNAVLSHFLTEGIPPVRQLVLGDDDDLVPDQHDLRSRLVATATIMGATFPEYDAWHDNAVKTNYGWHGYEPMRIAENFGH